MAQRNAQQNIISSLAKVYNSLFYIDMTYYMYFQLGSKLSDVKNVIRSSGNAIEGFKLMLEHLVDPDSLAEMRQFTDLNTLQHRLKDQDWISCQFKTPLYGWAEGIFIAGKRNRQGQCEHVIWGTRNITSLKDREKEYEQALEIAVRKAEAANQAKSNFLFSMSHDIRTPMNAIIGYTDLLEKTEGDKEKFRNYLAKIKGSSDILLSLINNVLEMARIESGKAVLDEEACSTSLISGEIETVYSELMKKKNINYVQKVYVDSAYVYGDRVKLNELYMNLISNAYKYTPEGGSVYATLRELPSDRPGWTILQSTIQDTGIGMSKEFLPHIFEDFTRASNTTATGIQGTGLGMPIVKKLVDLMGGTITVESELGKGTTFTVTLPHRIAAAPEECAAQESNLQADILAGKRVLLAEDNELNAEIATEILKSEGIQVEVAQDGIICVDMVAKAEAGYYDVILMDVQMPNMNGYEATTMIRRMSDKSKSAIPIVAMTANAFEEDKKNALAAGMNGHLAKPIEVPKLLETLNNIIKA